MVTSQLDIFLAINFSINPNWYNHLISSMAGSFLYTISKNEPCQVVPPTHLPWHAAYPTPRSFAASLSCQGSLQCFREGKLPGKGVALVEGLATHVFWGILGMPIQRRLTRVAGGTIKRSLNPPAQSLYPAVPTLYSLLLISNVQTRCLVLRSVSVLWTKGRKYYPFLTIFRTTRWSWNACC